MRIAIDATPLLVRSAGVKNYLYHWIASLSRYGGAHEIATYPVDIPPGPVDHERSQARPLATAAAIGLVQVLSHTNLAPPGWALGGCDVFHASHFIRKPPRRVRLTATIYDMTCWLTPELHSEANARVVRRFGEMVAARAAGLIAISESARADAIRILKLPPERIEAIHPGVAGTFFDASPEPAVSRRKLTRPYVLFVGTIEPRKNVGALLDAWLALAPSRREEYDLVIAGPAGWAEESLVARLRAERGVRYLGYVPEADLPGITAGASAFVYPSIYEGFGFPVAQAMAAGVPVITSAVSSLPEIAGEAALLVDPRSVAAIASALERLLGSESLRQRLAREGRERAEGFRWEACARKSLRFFERVAGVISC